MADIKAIVEGITAEFTEALGLPKDVVSDQVIDAGIEVLKNLSQAKTEQHFDPSISEALDKIKAVNVIDGEPIPAYQLEILKELIKKVALRKISELEEEQLKASHGKRKQAKKS